MESHFADNLFDTLSSLIRLILPSRSNLIFKNFLIVLIILVLDGGFILSEFLHLVMCWGVETLQTFLLFLAAMTCLYKLGSAFCNLDRLRHLSVLIRQLDTETRSAEMQEYLQGRIAMGRKIFRVYIVNSFLNWFGALFSAVISGNINFPAWFPLDWSSSRRNYWLVVGFQTVSHGFLIYQDALSDLIRIIYVLVIAGHFHVLGKRISQIGYKQPKDYQGNYEELIESIRKHKIILGILDELNLIISRTFFIVLLTVQINICIGIYYVFFTEGHFFLKSCLSSYVMSLFLLTALQCYFGSEIEEEGVKFMESLYSCNWPEQDRRFKKTVLIALIRLSRNNKIMAGGIIPVSLPTCLVVLKSSYSLFALLRHMSR